VTDLDPLNEEETRCARRKFTRHLYSLEHIEVFFVPSIRGIITRSVNVQREFRLPQGSIRVGIYAYSHISQQQPDRSITQRRRSDEGRFIGGMQYVDNFLGDLDDALAKERANRESRNAQHASA
jgi:hypothetical protein